jgi:hypothetical protein
MAAARPLWTAAAALDDALSLDRPARIEPDYAGLTIPPNIAPLNFAIQEPGSQFRLRLRGKGGPPIELVSGSPKFIIPERPWRALLLANQGAEIYADLWSRNADRRWQRFLALTNRVAPETLDPVLIYRKIRPAHSTWSIMGIYQRNLETFDETPILENRRFGGDCCHCHALRANSPDAATLLIRSKTYGNSLLIIDHGSAQALQGTLGFTAWNPQGTVLAASVSQPRLMLHTARNDMRDITELKAWIGCFERASNVVRQIPGLADETRLTTFPCWTPDGRYLYYCSAPNPWTNLAAATATSHTTAKYDLMRIAYDLHRDAWGAPELLLSARETGFSIAQPRISPDGRWLFFCAVPYGCWPTYDTRSDLYGLDLQAGNASGKFSCRKLELNSDACESWLSWSANSRWVVFSSKRLSPLLNRPFLSYVSPDGSCTKPFVVPQRDPAFYENLLRTYTMPTLATGPVTVPQRDLVAAVKNRSSPKLIMPPATNGLGPEQMASDPASH